MAAKKRSTSTPAKVAAKKAAPKKAAAPKATPETATKPKAAPKAAGAKKTAAKKAGIKVTDKQRELLQTVAGTGATGYTPASAAENRTLEALKEKKVVKSLAKNKETGKIPFAVTKAGEKVLTSS